MGLDTLKTYHAKRVLVVTDRYFSQKAREIGSLIPNAETAVFDEVIPDPPAELVAKGAAVCARFRPDLLIALGGGSPMDCAKGIKLAADHPISFVAIPTTSGSGSEVTSFSVLTHGGVKHPVVDGSLRPDAAILDDSLLAELPKPLIADTGMDMLAHAVEAVAAKGRTEFSDALAFHAVSLILQSLTASYQGDRSVRIRLHQAATMAGMAFDNAGLGLCHAMAHALGGRYHVPHGRLCGILLPKIMAVNTAALPQYARLARACGLSSATDRLSLRNLTDAITRLRTSLGMPSTLKEVGIQTEETGLIADILSDACCESNPVPVTEELVRSVLKAVRG